MKTLVLIPTYNERDNLRPLVDKILSLSNNIYILIIDDNSPDGTGKVADELARQFKNIFVLHREKKEGLGRAYVDGFKYALKTDADYIIQMDSDLSHNPTYIPEFLRKIQDYDVVIGSRFIPLEILGFGRKTKFLTGFIKTRAGIVNWPLYRLILTRGAHLYLRISSGLNLTDYTSGFKCFKRAVIKKLMLGRIKSSSYAFQFEINYLCYKNGFKIGEIPIIFYNRKRGASKIPVLKTVWDTLTIVWKLRWT